MKEKLDAFTKFIRERLSPLWINPDEPKFAEAINAMLATQDKGNLKDAVDTSHLKPHKGSGGLL